MGREGSMEGWGRGEVVGEMSGVGDGMVMVMMMRKTGHSDMDFVTGAPRQRETSCGANDVGDWNFFWYD